MCQELTNELMCILSFQSHNNPVRENIIVTISQITKVTVVQ